MSASVHRHAPWFAGQGGVTNLSKAEGRAFARELLESQDYRDGLRARIKTKTLEPSVEVMLWGYAYGKPTENININTHEGRDLSETPVTDLVEEHKKLGEMLRDLGLSESELLQIQTEAQDAASTVQP